MLRCWAKQRSSRAAEQSSSGAAEQRKARIGTGEAPWQKYSPSAL